MANEPEKSPNGIYVDTKTGDVVYEAPEEGVQIVAPGGELDAAAKARIEAVGGTILPVDGVAVEGEASEPLEVASAVEADDLEVADDPDKTVTTKTARGRGK
jgi:hypothetical protein